MRTKVIALVVAAAGFAAVAFAQESAKPTAARLVLYFECYDGHEGKAVGTSAEALEAQARQVCAKRCNRSGSKCGVNTLGPTVTVGQVH